MKQNLQAQPLLDVEEGASIRCEQNDLKQHEQRRRRAGRVVTTAPQQQLPSVLYHTSTYSGCQCPKSSHSVLLFLVLCVVFDLYATEDDVPIMNHHCLSILYYATAAIFCAVVHLYQYYYYAYAPTAILSRTTTSVILALPEVLVMMFLLTIVYSHEFWFTYVALVFSLLSLGVVLTSSVLLGILHESAIIPSQKTIRIDESQNTIRYYSPSRTSI